MSKFKCAICDLNLCSLTSYRNHCSSQSHIKALSIVRKSQPTAILNKETITEFNCKYCDKSYSNKSNLTRHKKTCQAFIDLKDRYVKNIDILIDKDIQVNSIIEPANINRPTKPNNNGQNNITINVQQNITNNIINADTITNNIQITPDEIFNNFWKQAGIRPFGFEDLSGLDNQEIADKIHSFGLNCFVEFITQIYKNTLNHNISLYNKREKLVKYVHKSGEVKIEPLVSVMSSLLMNLVDYLDTYLDRADIQVKQQYLPIIKKLKDIHALEDNPHLDKYNTHLYNRILNFSNSAAEKIKAFEQKLELELSDKLKELELSIPRTDSRTEADIIAE
jgi:hypothetical protein